MDCICTGGSIQNVTCTDASRIIIKTYSNSTYTHEKLAFSTSTTNVTITTGNWTANSNISIDIKDPSSTSVSGYPKVVTTNSSGGYQDIWPIVGPSGTYTVVTTDQIIVKNTTFSVLGCS